MPGKLVDCRDLMELHGVDSVVDKDARWHRLKTDEWHPVLYHGCDFDPGVFEEVSLNLIKNPNVNSSLLFRADILYDSQQTIRRHNHASDQNIHEFENLEIEHEIPGFWFERRIVRRMIPRNPQLDQPILQTCLFLKASRQKGGSHLEETLVVYIPHCASIDELPWYHPRIASLAYLHIWDTSLDSDPETGTSPRGGISLHYRADAAQVANFSPRLLRTGQHLLSTVYKHGQGRLAGYTKRVQHDQLISQQRVQDTYTELKKKYAKELCENWVEQTEPSKHVFEDLGIAAFLIELWKDLYPKYHVYRLSRGTSEEERALFPGFVDIGCGNGILVNVLLREGYTGWGFDARARKTWATFPPSIRKAVKQVILVPEPLTSLHSTDPSTNSCPSTPSRKTFPLSFKRSKEAYHNGIFPRHTFIISNHADELTAWTPLLASLSQSAFLCIPCCSHNLSGARFRAPSVFNGNTADTAAPSYFASQVTREKAIPIVPLDAPDDAEYFGGDDVDDDHHDQLHDLSDDAAPPRPAPPSANAAEMGDLTALNQRNRAKQPSAYSSLCDWVAHLALSVGYAVEKEMLRMPSTRNVGIVGRAWLDGYGVDSAEGINSAEHSETSGMEQRRKLVDIIVEREKVDGKAWVERAKKLLEGQGSGH